MFGITSLGLSCSEAVQALRNVGHAGGGASRVLDCAHRDHTRAASLVGQTSHGRGSRSRPLPFSLDIERVRPLNGASRRFIHPRGPEECRIPPARCCTEDARDKPPYMGSPIPTVSTRPSMKPSAPDSKVPRTLRF